MSKAAARNALSFCGFGAFPGSISLATFLAEKANRRRYVERARPRPPAKPTWAA
jgi:hypothetical protein